MEEPGLPSLCKNSRHQRLGKLEKLSQCYQPIKKRIKGAEKNYISHEVRKHVNGRSPNALSLLKTETCKLTVKSES